MRQLGWLGRLILTQAAAPRASTEVMTCGLHPPPSTKAGRCWPKCKPCVLATLPPSSWLAPPPQHRLLSLAHQTIFMKVHWLLSCRLWLVHCPRRLG